MSVFNILLLGIILFANSLPCSNQLKLDKIWPADNEHLERCVSSITIVRNMSSKGHDVVKKFLIDELKLLNFDVELDEFQNLVPTNSRSMKFVNIIGTINAKADKFLVLACHYDSKNFPDFQFVAAVDSAVPCALMLNTAKTLQAYLTNELPKQKEFGLKLIFFDGEEALIEWKSTDSLYGSRHLAEKWSQPPQHIKRIKLFVLLDLLGAALPKLYQFKYTNSDAFNYFRAIEHALIAENALEIHTKIFQDKQSSQKVQDDHLHFLKQNVSVVHLIPIPFPIQWHTINDDYQHLDWPTIRSFNTILRTFVYNFLLNNGKYYI